MMSYVTYDIVRHDVQYHIIQILGDIVGLAYTSYTISYACCIDYIGWRGGAGGLNGQRFICRSVFTGRLASTPCQCSYSNQIQQHPSLPSCPCLPAPFSHCQACPGIVLASLGRKPAHHAENCACCATERPPPLLRTVLSW